MKSSQADVSLVTDRWSERQLDLLLLNQIGEKLSRISRASDLLLSALCTTSRGPAMRVLHIEIWTAL
jgi:hypothetical protein